MLRQKCPLPQLCSTDNSAPDSTYWDLKRQKRLYTLTRELNWSDDAKQSFRVLHPETGFSPGTRAKVWSGYRRQLWHKQVLCHIQWKPMTNSFGKDTSINCSTLLVALTAHLSPLFRSWWPPRNRFHQPKNPFKNHRRWTLFQTDLLSCWPQTTCPRNLGPRCPHVKKMW